MAAASAPEAGAVAAKSPRVVICGGGIIGAASAFYLAARGLTGGGRVVVVERHEPACAASGNAGGFLALDWNDSSPVGPLARLSYALHAQLAQELGAGRIGYRRVNTLQVSVSEKASAQGSRGQRVRGRELLPRWVDGHVLGAATLGNPDSTAQVHPRRLTRALLEEAEARGAVLRIGAAAGLVTEAAPGGGRRVTGVRLEGGEVLPADVAVIAMGPWSGVAREWLSAEPSEPDLQPKAEPGVAAQQAAAQQAAAQQAGTRSGRGAESAVPAAPGRARSLLPRFATSGQKVHSVVLRPAAEAGIGAEMLFTGIKLASGRIAEPEVYPRPDGSVYVCGEGSESVACAELPPPGQVPVEGGRVAAVQALASTVAGCLAEAPQESSAACHLPLCPDGLPVIGPVPGCAGAFLATGHSCWGVLNGPATGMLLAGWIAEGRPPTEVDLSAFSPARFA